MASIRVSTPERRDRLWLLNAFAVVLLTLLGAAGRGSWLRPSSQIQHLETANAFAVPSGRHALRTYTNDARASFATLWPNASGLCCSNTPCSPAFTGSFENEGIDGDIQKFYDMALLLPTTGEKCLVQVKSQTSQSIFKWHVDEFKNYTGYSRMFFVYHTPSELFKTPKLERISIWARYEVAKQVVRAGLVEWVLERTT